MIKTLLIAGSVFFLLVLVIVLLVNQFPQTTDLGSSHSHFREIKGLKISSQQAIELAEPFLKKSYELRKKMRNESLSEKPFKEAAIWLSYKKPWYYVAQDHYPSYTPGYYLHHAVQVHEETGQVVEPQEN